MKVLLALDFSTTATGWARFSLTTGELLTYGVIEPDFKNPKVKGVPIHTYPEAQVLKIRRLSQQIVETLLMEDVSKIVIEEINGGSRAGRLSQKVLDGGHFVLLEKFPPHFLKMVSYYDSDGKDGWRSAYGLKLQLSTTDRVTNKDRKKMNKRLGKGVKKMPIITQKNLACRYVNKVFGLNLDCDLRTTDGDMADAIGLGYFYLTRIVTHGSIGKVS